MTAKAIPLQTISFTSCGDVCITAAFHYPPCHIVWKDLARGPRQLFQFQKRGVQGSLDTPSARQTEPLIVWLSRSELDTEWRAALRRGGSRHSRRPSYSSGSSSFLDLLLPANILYKTKPAAAAMAALAIIKPIIRPGILPSSSATGGAGVGSGVGLAVGMGVGSGGAGVGVGVATATDVGPGVGAGSGVGVRAGSGVGSGVGSGPYPDWRFRRRTGGSLRRRRRFGRRLRRGFGRRIGRRLRRRFRRRLRCRLRRGFGRRFRRRLRCRLRLGHRLRLGLRFRGRRGGGRRDGPRRRRRVFGEAAEGA